MNDIECRRTRSGTLRDDTVKGLHLRIGKNKKTWVFMLGVERIRHRLGYYPDMSLAEARIAARKFVHKPKAIDVTFKEALQAYVDLELKVNTREVTSYEYERVLRRDFLPRLKTYRVGEIRMQQITEILDGITSPTMKRRSYAYIRAFFNFCERRGYLEHSPVRRGGLPGTSKSRERVLSAEEIKDIAVAAIRGLDKSDYCRIVLLLLFTGQRRKQFAELRYDMIDLSQDFIEWPAEFMKSGHKHQIPFSVGVRELLFPYAPVDTLRRLHGLVFPAKRTIETPIGGWSKLKAAFDKKCGVTGWTLHDLRRTWSTLAAELGEDRDVVERILAHRSVTGGVRGIYDRFHYMPQMRTVMQNMESRINEIMSIELKRAARYGS